MGGHGGLNILPQKRWNVYGRENRLKVRRDEEQAAVEQAEKDAVHRKAESEFRHLMLLRRAQARSGAADSSQDGAPAAQQLEDAEAISAMEALQGSSAVPPRSKDDLAKADLDGSQPANEQIVPAEDSGARKDFDVLDFLRTEPKGKAHPEVDEERRREAQKRGEAKTQTSDPKFDAQFAFGHGVTGDANKPWYARAQPPPVEPSTGSKAAAPICAIEFRPNRSSVDVSAANGEGAVESDGSEDRRRASSGRHTQDKAQKRKEKAKKDKKKKKQKRSRSPGLRASDGGGQSAIEALRKERLEREAAERDKAKHAVLAATGRFKGEPEGKRYHSSFGNSGYRT